ncbi:MAG: radical SAM/SPASM domain-containing protein [Candidatus Nanohaloarchaea archaeon]
MKKSELMLKIPKYKAFRSGHGTFLPANMTFSVIDRCNMACRTCGIWKHRNTDEMTVEEYEKIVEPLNLFWATISGGEPFMREDIAEVLEVIVNRTQPSFVTIATNGMMDVETREAMTKVLANTSDTKFMLNFSIDGTSETHEYMRRTKNAFQRVSNTIEEVRSLESDRISIGANTVISKYNEDEIPETYQDIQEKLNPDSYIVEVAEQRDKLYNEDMDFAPENPDKALKFLLEKLQEEQRTGPARLVGLMRKGFYRWLMSEQELTNYTGFISAQSNPTGEVWPTSMSEQKMGNLREQDHDFKKVWRSREAENVRNYIRRENPQDMLANSFYNNMLANPQKLLRLLLQ